MTRLHRGVNSWKIERSDLILGGLVLLGLVIATELFGYDILVSRFDGFLGALAPFAKIGFALMVAGTIVDVMRRRSRRPASPSRPISSRSASSTANHDL